MFKRKRASVFARVCCQKNKNKFITYIFSGILFVFTMLYVIHSLRDTVFTFHAVNLLSSNEESGIFDKDSYLQ